MGHICSQPVKKQSMVQHAKQVQLEATIEKDQAKYVIQTYRDTKISRKVQKLDKQVKDTFGKQFPKKHDELNQHGQTSSIQQRDTLINSQRTPLEDSECDWRDLQSDRNCFTLSDGHIEKPAELP